MADYTPVYEEPTASLTASATITGGQLVEVTGSGTVGPAAAASAKVVGVAAFDAVNGQRVTVFTRGIVHEVTASGAITAGDSLAAAAAGKVVLAGANPPVGIALTTAADAALVRYVSR